MPTSVKYTDVGIARSSAMTFAEDRASYYGPNVRKCGGEKEQEHAFKSPFLKLKTMPLGSWQRIRQMSRKVKIKLINWVKSSVVPVGESDFGARSPLISLCVIYQLVAGFKA